MANVTRIASAAQVSKRCPAIALRLFDATLLLVRPIRRTRAETREQPSVATNRCSFTGFAADRRSHLAKSICNCRLEPQRHV